GGPAQPAAQGHAPASRPHRHLRARRALRRQSAQEGSRGRQPLQYLCACGTAAHADRHAGERLACRGDATCTVLGVVRRGARGRQQPFLRFAERAQPRRDEVSAPIRKRTMRGKLITLEGIDGAGKTSFVACIERRLRANGVEVVLTREPGGTPVGEELRRIVLSAELEPVTEALLMFAARKEHLVRVIVPALERGAWVVCDRFTDATFAYQGAGRGVDSGFLATL